MRVRSCGICDSSITVFFFSLAYNVILLLSSENQRYTFAAAAAAAKSLQSCPTCATPWTAAYQASLSMGFSRQEHWSGFCYMFLNESFFSPSAK